MSTSTINIKVPIELEMNEFELSFFLAAKLYEAGKLSLGQAAEMARVSKLSFIETIGKLNISLFSENPDDIEQDYKNA